MHSGDTTLGGGDRAFPETTIGFSGGLRGPQAREELCRRYWKPVYSYIRIAWAKSNEDAKDVAQEFFLSILEDGLLERYDPARGGFRAYLKVLLRTFVAHGERDLRRLKRGGGARLLPLDGELPILSGAESDPEKAFERVWLQDLVDQAIARVRSRNAERFRVYEAVAMGAERLSYADAAARLGLTVSEVEKSLYLVREEIRRELRAALAEGAGSDRELDDEWKRLLGD